MNVTNLLLLTVFSFIGCAGGGCLGAAFADIGKGARTQLAGLGGGLVLASSSGVAGEVLRNVDPIVLLTYATQIKTLLHG
ncbi:MAG: hypothetical protein ABSF50_05355 [Burkholderiaceae bacterium]|jgi:hypothetical protein